MACRISELVIDSRDPERLAAFWCDVLGYVVLDRVENSVEIGPEDEGFGGLQPTIVFDLTDKPKAGKLSGGERKMLAMGRVLMLDPGLFLLDEPTANLAPAIAIALLEEHVRGLAASGAAVLIVEQRAKAVLAISDHTYVLGGGEVRMEGTPAELSVSPEFIESFLGGRARPVGSAEG